MQAISKNEDERSSNQRVNTVDFVIHAGRIGRCLKGKYSGRLGGRIAKI